MSLGNGSYVVAELDATYREESPASAVDIYLFVSGSDQWKVLKRHPVRCGNGDLLELSRCRRWSTNRVLAFRRRFLVWVDYYRGMIFMDMERPWRKPDLRYVPLPVGAAERIVHDDRRKYGTRCPEAYNNMCATRSGIRFVSVKRWSTDDFSITTWSLCDADYTWREEATPFGWWGGGCFRLLRAAAAVRLLGC